MFPRAMAPGPNSSLSAKCRNLESLLLDALSSFSSLRDTISADSSLHCLSANDAVRRLDELQCKLKLHLCVNGSSSKSYGEEVDAWKVGHRWLEQDCSYRFMDDEAIREIQRWKQAAEKKEGEIWRLNATVEKLVKKKEMLEQKVRKLERKLQSMATAMGGTAAQKSKSRGMVMAMSAEDEDDDDDDDEQRIWSSSGGADPATEMEMVLGKEETAMAMVKKAAEKAVQRTGELATAMAEKMKGLEMAMEMEKMAMEMVKQGNREKQVMMVKWAAMEHKKLAVKGYVSKVMFSGFQHEDFFMSGALRSLLQPHRHSYECWQQYRAMAETDPLQFILAGDMPFGQFCRKKFLSLFPAASSVKSSSSTASCRKKALEISGGSSFRKSPPHSGSSVGSSFRKKAPETPDDGSFRKSPPDSGSPVVTSWEKTPEIGGGRFIWQSSPDSGRIAASSRKKAAEISGGSSSFRQSSPDSRSTTSRREKPSEISASFRQSPPDSSSSAAISCRNLLPLLLGGAPTPDAEDLPRALADPDQPFLTAFVRAAHAVWVFHRLAFAVGVTWRPAPFWASPGAEFSAVTMSAAVENGLELASDDDSPSLLPSVAFTVLPGFRSGAHHVLVRCSVYLNGMKPAGHSNVV